MDWKKENPRNRFIDDLNWDEAFQVAFLAAGQPEDFQLLKIDAKVNGNNIPHVILKYKYYEYFLGNAEIGTIGIFSNLNTYQGENNFNSCYCQKELFKLYEKLGYD